ncbi:MAG: alkaline phosphatase family protein [Pirellulaceae bacterium]|nr:alkaline phosphatase family protein [Pirellulaceae bacterium]
MNTSRRGCWLAVGLWLLGVLAAAGPLRAERPKLIVLVTVDQLRGDMPSRLRERFGPGGFRYLMEQGVVYNQAYYEHSTTFTAVGHATLATGGHGAQHGMAGNDWFDQQTGQQVYCVEDDRHHLLGSAPKAHAGTSPRNLTSTTFGDELVESNAGRSRVFSVSIKDRGAIIPGGHRGKAFWYAPGSGQFVTSTYYYQQYPEWVERWNGEKHADQFRGRKWDLLHDRATYLAGDRDDRPFEQSFKLLGRTFPHPLDNPEPADFYATLATTPMGDELTLNFVRALVEAERVGQGEATDMLAIGFSVTDYIGHAFGPNSLEAEDNLLRLDRTLAELFEYLEEKVGLDRTLIALSSDHGVDSSPEYSLSLGLPAGRHDPVALLQKLNDGLRQRLQVDEDLVTRFFNPGLYLDLAALERHRLDVRRVERMLAEEVLRQPGFAYAVTRTSLLAGGLPPDPILQKVQRAFHPQRSGNVSVVQSPSWFLYGKPTDSAAMHGSPYPYDTYVPLMFAGAGMEPAVVERLVSPADLAPTICGVLGIKPPTGSTGKPLVEVLQSRR